MRRFALIRRRRSAAAVRNLARGVAVLVCVGGWLGHVVPVHAIESPLSLHVTPGEVVAVRAGEQTILQSPPEGLWSVALAWREGWPDQWQHAVPRSVEHSGPWTVASGALKLPGGVLECRDSYRQEGPLIRCVRRYTWRGAEPLSQCTLSVRWQAPGAVRAKPLLPGILYYGNPSGARTGPHAVAVHTGAAGDESIFEEHRYAAPFACLEWDAGAHYRSAALHSLPSRVAGGNHADQWWSLGVRAAADHAELVLLSGPCAANGQRSVVKALQQKFLPYPDAWMTLRPGAVVEKTFFLQACPKSAEGAGFREPLRASWTLHEPSSLEGLPTLRDIVREKYRFAVSRFRDREADPGFEMYPDYVEGTHYVMGWCGQAAALGGALLRLEPWLDDPRAGDMAVRSLDHLATAPFNESGFWQRYTAETGAWSEQDPVSQGQAMENFARAIAAGRQRGKDTTRWEAFLRKACELQAARILQDDWRPVSTAEAFYVSPLGKGALLWGDDALRKAALKATDHYIARHLDMREPYWGGTLDARCEDKEGALAGFQAFLAAYDLTGEQRYLDAASHALDVALTYTVVWDIDLPPGRLRDHGLKTRGWTIVSAQNQHLDVYSVLFTPEIWRMGELLGRPELKRMAALMYRSCGQLIDPYGSQGEQIQHTNFGQSGDMSDVFRMRGAYSEGWTVFWITAHFLNAAGQFAAMGVDIDAAVDALEAATETPAPLYRDPIYDGAADPVLVWNPERQAWWMLYTQRRAKLDLPGVEWCHGTEIGVAESRDLGATWHYVGTLPLTHPDEQYSFWAPDVVRDDDGVFRLFVTYVPGPPETHRNWGGTRFIYQYRAHDLWNWQFEQQLPLASEYCIDPSVFRRPDGSWRLWYKDEGHRSQTFAVESRDLATWTPVDDPGVSELYGEAPKVFRLGDYYWMLKDPNSGLDVYRSADLDRWEYQGKILERPGRRNSDATIGKHADVVVVSGDHATIVYFTHPYTEDAPQRDGVSPLSNRHTAIQAAELTVRDGRLACDRDEPFLIRLAPPE